MEMVRLAAIGIRDLFLAREAGLDLPCGAGRVAALTCHRHVIHSRGAASLPSRGSLCLLRASSLPLEGKVAERSEVG